MSRSPSDASLTKQLSTLIQDWAAQIEAAYGHLPSHEFPGPPTELVQRMRAEAARLLTSPDEPAADLTKTHDLVAQGTWKPKDKPKAKPCSAYTPHPINAAWCATCELPHSLHENR